MFWVCSAADKLTIVSVKLLQTDNRQCKAATN